MPIWQVILADPFADVPPTMTDPEPWTLSGDELRADRECEEVTLARTFTRSITRPEVAIVASAQQDAERHRYTPWVKTVWFR